MKAIYTNIAVIGLTLVAVYFSLEQKRKFDQVHADKLDYIDKNKGINKNIDIEKVDIKEAEKTLAEIETKRAELQASVDARKATGEGFRLAIRKHDAMLVQIKDQKTKLDGAREQLNKMLGEIGGDNLTADNLEESLTKVQEQKANRVAALDEIDLATAKTQKAIEANTAERERLTLREEERIAGLERNSLEAVITGVNQEWGFIVIGAGANSGFTPQSGLIVQRDGRMIARVRPSSIEPTQTIAEINYGSLAPGVRIQPGDRVIFESRNVN